ncbi:MAG: FtsQ-type POTRA domain-containing protein [Bacilli bacterium]|nr:FtsQ-type POTRA domain-containing protein [Bacilli bacterium]
MKKKAKVKKKFKIKNIIISLILIIIIGFLGYYILNTRIKNIYVSGNTYLKEQEIIDLSGIKDYPKRIEVSKNDIKNNLVKSPMIDNVDISITLTNKVYIKINESRPLFFDEYHHKYLLANGKYIDKIDLIGLPILTSNLDDEMLIRFAKAFNKVNDDVLNKISEVSYTKTDLDKDRFLLYMNDRIYVYITLTKIDNLNNYNEIVKELDGKKGILYLDSGNHFEIKDNIEKEASADTE